MNNPRCEIKAMVLRKRESAESKKAELNLDCDILDSYDDLLKRDDIDIISICSPNNYGLCYSHTGFNQRGVFLRSCLIIWSIY
ncbi:MAG: hypothetical protein JSV25_07895 [Spirochaetota bacterium]|nr:MAG: hypothetical protein JSV25_07895 [Spirochaetota bacterium]